MMHRYEIERTELAIYMRYKLRNLVFELRRVRQRRCCDLN